MQEDPTKRFSDRVENYVKFRPDYPVGLVEALLEKTGADPASALADVGSGTGIFSGLLLGRVGRVYAVEPNAEMRAAAEARHGDHDAFASVAATAEDTGLPEASVDLVTVAQAFHWLEPAAARREFARILKPGGWAALIWNERLADGTPFLDAYDALLRRAAPEQERTRLKRIDEGAIDRFFRPGSYERIEVPNAQTFDLEGLIGRALSSSYVPNPGQSGHAAFIGALRELHSRYAVDGRVEMLYRTRLYLGRLA